MGLNSFCSQNIKTDNSKQHYLSIGELAETLDEMMIMKKSSQIQFESRNDLPVLARQKNMLSSKSIKTLTLAERVEKIRKLQQNYSSLKKTPATFDSADTSNSNLVNGVLNLKNCTLSIALLPNLIATTDI